MISGPADGRLLLLIPDDTCDPCRAGGVPLDLLAAPPPRRSPLRAGEVLREEHRAHRVCCRQITVCQGTEHRCRQMHDAYVPRGTPTRRARRLRWNHRASLPHGRPAGTATASAQTLDQPGWRTAHPATRARPAQDLAHPPAAALGEPTSPPRPATYCRSTKQRQDEKGSVSDNGDLPLRRPVHIEPYIFGSPCSGRSLPISGRASAQFRREAAAGLPNLSACRRQRAALFAASCDKRSSRRRARQ